MDTKVISTRGVVSAPALLFWGGGATVLLNASAPRITCRAAESSLVPSVQGELRRLLVSISYGAERI